MFGFFKESASRTQIQLKVSEWLSSNTDLDLGKTSGWKLAKATDKFVNEIRAYKDATEAEELTLFLVLLHEAGAFQKLENEVLLGILIKLWKLNETNESSGDEEPFLGKELNSRVELYVKNAVLVGWE